MKFVSVKDSAIAQYWDYEHNTADPATVASKSGKKFWWICPECHQPHEKVAQSQHKSPLCRKCGQRKGVANGYKSRIAKTHSVADDSVLIKYWDYERNTVSPSDITYKSTKKYCWICAQCGQPHERSADGEQKSQLCRKCGSKKGIANGQKTHLSKTLTVADVPLLLNQWDYDKNPMPPSEVASKCNKKFWWICAECGESFQRGANHEHETQLCRTCGLKHRTENNKAAKLVKSHSIADDPILSKYWDYDKNTEDPKTLLFRNQNFYYWKCPKCGVSYKRRTAYQYVSSHLCNECSDKQRRIDSHQTRLKHYETVADRPNMMAQWDFEKNDINPNQVSAHGVSNYWWKCPHCGKPEFTSPDKKYEYENCLECGRKRIGKTRRKNEVKRKGSFGDQHPLLAKEWHPTLNGDVTPYDVTSGCGDEFYWQCKYGHVYKTTIHERVKRHAGCPTCRTSLRTSFTEQAIAFYLSKVVKVDQHFKHGGFNFDMFIEPFKTVVEYDGMFWHAKADTAKRDTRKDKYCKKRGWRIIRVKESEKINRVEGNRIYAQRRNTDYVWLIDQVCNLLGVLPPIDINIERDTPEIYARVNPVAKEGSLADKKPELLKYWDKEANLPVTPDMVTPFSHLTFSWHCPDCGHDWMQRLIEISNRKIKCPQCREKAFAEKGLKANGQYKKGRKAE